MRYALLLLALAACAKDSGGPAGLDPIVLFNNVLPGAPNVGGTVTMVWYDQSGQVSKTEIPFEASRCIKFVTTRLADSVRFEMYAGDTLSTTSPWWRGWSPWFDPLTGGSSMFADMPDSLRERNFPNGAEYWVVDFSKQPWMWNPPEPPC